MGFRCPNCGEDFGNNQNAFKRHINDSIKCYSDVHFELTKIEFNANIHVEKKKRTTIFTTPGMYKSLDINKNNVKRDYDFIGDHDWEKLNMVSLEDGSDNLRCRKCGLTANRLFDRIKSDKRFSANKIENCKTAQQ